MSMYKETEAENSKSKEVVVATVSRAVATTRDHAPFPQAHPLAMDPWIADPDSWQDMVDDWMGEPAGVLCEVRCAVRNGAA